MRRVVAALMSVLFSFWLITPAISAPADDTPACCRREGKHHCKMGQTGTDGARLTNARCDQYHWQTATIVPQSLDIAQSARLLSPDGFDLSPLAPGSSHTPSAVILASQTRGPPQS